MIFSHLAFGVTEQEFREATGFEDGRYEDRNHNEEKCGCEDFELINDELDGLMFFSVNCMAIPHIGAGKQTSSNHQCNIETTSRLMGKTLTYVMKKTCGEVDLEKHPDGTSAQENAEDTITITFVENGFNYVFSHKVGEKKPKVSDCQMRKYQGSASEEEMVEPTIPGSEPGDE